jgi:predicted Zn-dependent protease
MRTCLERFALVTAVAVAVASCSSQSAGGGSSQPSSAELFSSQITSVTVEIDYQTGAEPYTGSAGRLKDVWQVTRDNVDRVFSKSAKALTLPTTLPQMQPLTDVTATTFTTDDVLAIASKHRDTPSAGSMASFYVVFLNGYFSDGATAQKDVLGVSIGHTGVLAMFKPVIAGTDSAGVARFVEQSTMVHELGHAFGLVDNGVAMASPHEDAAHPAHCTNEKCAMYWANEGASAAVTFVRQVLVTGSNVLYGPECLGDVDAAAH